MGVDGQRCSKASQTLNSKPCYTVSLCSMLAVSSLVKRISYCCTICDAFEASQTLSLNPVTPSLAHLVLLYHL